MTVPLNADQHYLKNDQYKNSSNLDARVAIHQEFSTNPYGWFNWVFDRLAALPADAKILELGCGNGVLWKKIAGRIPAGWNITLSDFSAGMLDAAWRNLVVTGRAFKFEEIDAQSIPYVNDVFDAVIANHMLYHVPDRQGAMREIRRVLKPAGRLFATTVGENHLRQIKEWRKRITHDKYVPFTSSFTLENGMEQLRLVFREVKLSRYEDSLQVTRVEPILAHMRSMVSASDVDQAELEKNMRRVGDTTGERRQDLYCRRFGLVRSCKVIYVIARAVFIRPKQSHPTNQPFV